MVDLDSVVCDFQSDISNYFIEELKCEGARNPITSWNFPVIDWGITIEEWDKGFAQGVRMGKVFRDAPDMPGAISALHKLKLDKHEIHIITSRKIAGAEREAALSTMDWLTDRSVWFDSLTFSNDKTVIPCDIAFDDRVENLEALRGAGTIAVSYDHPWNKHWDGLRAFCWGDFLKLVKDLDTYSKG